VPNLPRHSTGRPYAELARCRVRCGYRMKSGARLGCRTPGAAGGASGPPCSIFFPFLLFYLFCFYFTLNFEQKIKFEKIRNLDKIFKKIIFLI
jgi:hypothetical protein